MPQSEQGRPIQVRYTGGEIQYFTTLGEAFVHIKGRNDVEKVSFDAVTGERIRLVCPPDGGGVWVFEPLAAHLKDKDLPILDPTNLNPNWG